MRITRLEYKNNKIFNNLVLNLSRSDGSAYKKIIILGENGAGKTTILNDLYLFLGLRDLNFEKIDYIGDNNEQLSLTSNQSQCPGFHKIYQDGQCFPNNSNSNNNKDSIKSNVRDIRKHGVIYSKVQVNFSTNRINNIGSSDINDKTMDEQAYDFTKLKQLLIDLAYQDSNNFSNMNETGKISKKEFNEKYSKLYRFKTAINSFFDDLKFTKIDKVDDRQEVIFEKNGKAIYIDDLSTGEKQIVFRGVYILKNIGLHGNGFVLIDEPEISMHPRWEDKIFDYYSNLIFVGENPIGQLFIATHSDRLLKQAMIDKDALIVEIKNNKGNVEFNRYDSQLILPYKSDAEVNYKIFKIYSNDLHLQLYDYIQTSLVHKTDVKIKDVDDYIMNDSNYDASIHRKNTTHNSTVYNTICTAIRNELHHGNPNNISDEDLKKSIDLMYKICGGII